MKYALMALLPSKVDIIQSAGVTDDEIRRFVNYAFPYGSDWGLFVGARSIKVFHINPAETCFAYTIITQTNNDHLMGALYCLATIYDRSEVHDILCNHDDWIARMIKPMVAVVEDNDLKKSFHNTVSTRKPRSIIKIHFWHWLLIQFRQKVAQEFHFYNANSWIEREEYARSLYLATAWQTILIRPPSLTTLTLSKGEFTDISIIATR